MDLPIYIVGLSYIPIYFPWISQHFPRPPGYPGQAATVPRRSWTSKSSCRTLIRCCRTSSGSRCRAQRCPSSFSTILEEFRNGAGWGPPIFPKKRGSNWENLGENDQKCIPAYLKWRYRAIEPKFFLVLMFSMYT